MSEHTIELEWSYRNHPQTPAEYDRNHTVTVNGAQKIGVSAATDFLGDANKADPEQLLTSSVSSCHMLFFLAIAKMRGFEVTQYSDRATAYLGKDGTGGMAVTRIVLRPQMQFSDDKRPDEETLKRIHEHAHKKCFIANSIKAEVSIE